MKDLLKNCKKCKGFEMVLIDKPKPCLESKIYDGLEDKEIEAVFIAESPPPEGYFYDESQCRKGSLRERLLSFLDLKSLEDFKEQYFLTDSIKCRIRKNGRRINSRLIKNCLPILKEEIELFEKMGISKIVILGRMALKTFQIIGFNKLKGKGIKKDYGKVVEEGSFEFFISPLPFDRNKRYWDEKTKNRLRDFLGISIKSV